MEEIKSAFIEESEELFESISALLVSAEENGDLSKEDIDTLFRDIHTLKGGSGSIGFDKFAKITHIFENFMDMLRNGELSLTTEMIDFLIDESDELSDILGSEFDGSLSDEEFENTYNRVKSVIEKFKSTPQQDKSKRAEKVSGKEKLIQNNGGEIVDLFDRINEKLSFLVNCDDVDSEDIAELFRDIHTLKSSAMFIGMHFFPKYIHEIESFLDDVRNGIYIYSPEVNKFLQKSIKIAEALIDEELNNNKTEIEDILKDTKKELNIIKSSNKDFESDVGYELFDDDSTQGFELFDDDIEEEKPIIEKEANEVPIEKQEKKAEVITKKKENKKIVKASEKSKKSFKNIIATSSIRVGLDKIDVLMNKVGDLVITKSMLFEFAEIVDDYSIKNLIIERLEVLDRNIRELQESVMGVRMIPMNSVYSKLPKIIRDLARKLNKSVKFEHYGDSVEIDKLMVESLMDPLTHILRNSLDHGIEKPEDRKKANKSKDGKVIITASQESGQIIITIEDDGAGINGDKVAQKAVENGILTEEEFEKMSEHDKVMLIFAPGLSTAETVSDVSGRGVGMDVVMNNINSIGGTIKVETKEGVGTKFIIILPLTLAILDGLNVTVGEHRFIYPLNMVMESFQPIPDIIKNIADKNEEILIVRNEFIPVIRLHNFFNIKPKYEKLTKGIVIISKIGTSKIAIFVDEFSTQEQIVVKSLDKNYKKVKGISASTIRGDGSVGLILDIADIVSQSKENR